MNTIKRWVAALALWLLEWSERGDEPRPDPIVQAVRMAYLQVGLPAEQFSPSFDLLRAGKLADVLHLAGTRLGVDTELNTVEDVVNYLGAE